jgi:hypothetical protein
MSNSRGELAKGSHFLTVNDLGLQSLKLCLSVGKLAILSLEVLFIFFRIPQQRLPFHCSLDGDLKDFGVAGFNKIIGRSEPHRIESTLGTIDAGNDEDARLRIALDNPSQQFDPGKSGHHYVCYYEVVVVRPEFGKGLDDRRRL